MEATLLTLLLGMCFAVLTFLLSDINQGFFGFRLTGDPGNDFAYSVFGIGAIEEFVKLVPLLLLIRFTKYVNESYDYIFYASLSALGFAFLENLLYFDPYQLHIISSRALVTSVGHMFLSSIVAYAFILNKYRYRSKTYWRIGLFFLLASLGHGFYDFWLINDVVSDFGFFSILFFICGISIWNSFKNNALNHSEFFNRKKKLDPKAISNFVLYGLGGVILFEYLALSISFGPTVGNQSFFDSLMSGGYLLFFITIGLGKLRIKRGQWFKIRYWGTKDEFIYDGDPKGILNHHVRINPYSNHDFQHFYLPNTGRVLDMQEVELNSNWYLVELDEKGSLDGFHPGHLIFRPKEGGETVNRDRRIFVGVYLIKDHISPNHEEFEGEDLVFIHWATVVQRSS